MTFFGFHGFKNPKASRKPPLMHPDNAPRTIRNFPDAFRSYTFGGLAIEKVSHNGIRRPALVAQLVREYHFIDGAVVTEEMTASLRDLIDGRHPKAEEIAATLRDYYHSKIPSEQQEKGRRKTSGTSRLTMPDEICYADRGTALFEKLNLPA